MNGLKQLVDIQEKYSSAHESWQKMVENLQGLQNLIPSLPKHTIDCGGHRFVFNFADVEVFCHFTFAHPDGVLLFGYKDIDLSGSAKDIVTDKIYFDKFGNGKNKPDQTGSSFNITSGEDLADVFFDKLHKALQRRFADVARF